MSRPDRDYALNLPDYLPERVKRAYRVCGKRWTHRDQLRIYTFEMTEPIHTSVLEDTFGVVCSNYTGPVSRINLDWCEYDNCYIITLNHGDEEFIDLANAVHVPRSEDIYAKWQQMLFAIMEGDI